MSTPFNFAFASPVEDILKKPNFTIQDLLDEDETVVETRNHKKDLVAFLVKPENISQLVTYIVEEPPSGASTNVKFRYPVVACEILCAAVNDIETVFLQETNSNPQQLERVFNFFKNRKINLLLSNLVIKLAKTITTSKPAYIFKYFKTHPQVIDYFLSHLEAAAVPDYFTHIISLDEDLTNPNGTGSGTESKSNGGTDSKSNGGTESKSNGGVSIQDFLTEIKFVEKIIKKLSPENVDYFPDIMQAILDVIAVVSSTSKLMNDFISEKTSNLLLGLMLDPNNKQAFKYGIRIFIRLLRAIGVAQDMEDNDNDKEKKKKPKPDRLRPLNQLPPLVQNLTKNLNRFKDMLLHSWLNTKINDQMSASYEAFGFERYYVLEVFEGLISLNYLAVRNVIMECDFLNVVFDLIFKFPHNNFCHRLVENILVKFLAQITPDLQLKVIEKLDLVKRITGTQRVIVETADKRAPPYVPYLNRIAINLHQLGKKEIFIRSALQSDPKWDPLIDVLLEEMKKNEMLSTKLRPQSDQITFQTSLGTELEDQDEDDDDEENDDLLLDGDKDLESNNDTEDYDLEQAEILLSKQEVEAFA